ncbi:MAG TPA: hypothetical protein VN603_12090 [Candidatus Acidoferrales bacterium]|nr:hypothetical protein [Candidatus Acidoferrales bacterium]
MTVEPLVPDVAVSAPRAKPDASRFLAALDAAGSVFAAADRSEEAFVEGRGGLQEMIVSRAHADVAISIASAAATRAAQALAQIFNMPI